MNKSLRVLVALGTAAVCAAFGGGAAAQQPYPSKPIHLVVPFAPGGATDLLARTVGSNLTRALGQPIIVDNKPGAGTIIGAEAVARSAPDGYALLMATSTTLAINPSLYHKLQYDPVKDFAPLAMVASVPFVLIVNASAPVHNVAELVSLVRTKPSTYASAGKGTMHHLAAELFKTVAGVDILHVPYKGSSPAVSDLLSGQVTMMFTDLAPALPLIASGRLRALAVTTPQRIEVLPDVPTIAESGYPGFEAIAWQAVVAPAGISKDIESRLSAEINNLLAQPAVRQQILKLGMIPYAMRPDQMPGYLVAEIARWKKIVQSSVASAD